MNTQKSIEAQAKAGTKERNAVIQSLAKSGMSYAEIGRIYGLSRERPRQIMGLPTEASQDGKSGGFREWLKGFIGFFIRGG